MNKRAAITLIAAGLIGLGNSLYGQQPEEKKPGRSFAPSPEKAAESDDLQMRIKLNPGIEASQLVWSVDGADMVAIKREVLTKLDHQLQEMKRQLAERDAQLLEMRHQLMVHQRRQPLPPLEDAQAKVYHLKYAPPREAAQTIESLIGTATLRIAVDERNNSLIIYGKADSLGAIDTLLAQIDRQAAPQNAAEDSKQGGAAAPRSLLVRVFWLADGLPKDEGEDAARFLPQSVLQATQRLGLKDPLLVTQTVNSLAVNSEEDISFATHVPAIIARQPAELTAQGSIRMAQDERARMDLTIHVSGPSINSKLSGSLAAPLGHYTVLGTANSVIWEPAPAARPVRGGGFGPEGGRGFGPGMPGRGFGFSEMRPGTVADDVPDEGDELPREPKATTSRFAFVVQVIEGESFPAENAKTQAEPPHREQR